VGETSSRRTTSTSARSSSDGFLHSTKLVVCPLLIPQTHIQTRILCNVVSPAQARVFRM
jgi:hypothetical protein